PCGPCWWPPASPWQRGKLWSWSCSKDTFATKGPPFWHAARQDARMILTAQVALQRLERRIVGELGPQELGEALFLRGRKCGRHPARQRSLDQALHRSR